LGFFESIGGLKFEFDLRNSAARIILRFFIGLVAELSHCIFQHKATLSLRNFPGARFLLTSEIANAVGNFIAPNSARARQNRVGKFPLDQTAEAGAPLLLSVPTVLSAWYFDSRAGISSPLSRRSHSDLRDRVILVWTSVEKRPDAAKAGSALAWPHGASRWSLRRQSARIAAIVEATSSPQPEDIAIGNMAARQ
jgi:hypothetical protein